MAFSFVEASIPGLETNCRQRKAGFPQYNLDSPVHLEGY